MPSLILTGHPCALKTSFARLLSQRALRHPSRLISDVTHITESDASPHTKAEAYENSANEKIVRAALKSAFDRAVASADGSTLVLLDSLNYIKGYRYELYCISKAAGERHGVVWILGESDALARERNRRRRRREEKTNVAATSGEDDDEDEDEDDGYYHDDAIMDELVLRFEPPDDRNRWENPLYKVDMSRVSPWGKNGTLERTNEAENGDGSPLASAVVHEEKPTGVPPIKSAAGFKRNKKSMQRDTPQSKCAPSCPVQLPTVGTVTSMASRNLATAAAAATAHSPNTQTDTTTIEQVIDNILDSFLIHVQPLKEGLSTLTHSSAESNLLNLMDATSQRINNDIVKAQKNAATTTGEGGGKIVIPLQDEERGIVLKQSLTVQELRHVRKQYLKWMASHPLPNGTSEEEIAENYIQYIESHI